MRVPTKSLPEQEEGNRTPARIFLVDDHPLVLLSLREFIKQATDLIVCGEAEDRETALAAIAETKPHLAIIDLTLKNSSGMELIKDLRVFHPEVKILVLSMHDETFYAERVIRAGALGYVTKQEATTKIMAAIRQVLKGEIYWSEKAAAKVASQIAGKVRPATSLPMDTLTDREVQVFELIGKGHSTRQISAALHIDVSTVETYRSRIKEKLNLETGLELLQHAIRWHVANTAPHIET